MLNKKFKIGVNADRKYRMFFMKKGAKCHFCIIQFFKTYIF